jgi:acyl-CoA thioesterase
VLFSLADAVFAYASNRHGVPAVALDTSMTFVSAARADETLVARCQEEALRRSVAVYSVRITAGERLVALFRGTVFRRADSAPNPAGPAALPDPTSRP